MSRKRKQRRRGKPARRAEPAQPSPPTGAAIADQPTPTDNRPQGTALPTSNYADDGAVARYSRTWRAAPPLLTWGIAAVLVGLLVAGSSYRMSRVELPAGDSIDIEDVRKRLAAYGDSRTGAGKSERTLVVAVGTSLLRAAFPDDETSPRVFEHLGYDRLDFVRLALNGPLIVYQTLPLFDELLEGEPDLVLIENQVLTWHNQRRVEGPLDDHRKYLLSSIKQLFGGGGPVTAFADPQLEAGLRWSEHEAHFAKWDHARKLERLAELQSPEELFKLKLRKAVWSGCPAQLPEEIARFLDAARRQGTQVALVDISVSEPARRIVPPTLAACQASWDRRLQEEHGVRSLVSPDDLGLEHYIDYSHLNTPGRIEFSTWLLPEVLALVGREEQR